MKRSGVYFGFSNLKVRWIASCLASLLTWELFPWCLAAQPWTSDFQLCLNRYPVFCCSYSDLWHLGQSADYTIFHKGIYGFTIYYRAVVLHCIPVASVFRQLTPSHTFTKCYENTYTYIFSKCFSIKSAKDGKDFDVGYYCLFSVNPPNSQCDHSRSLTNRNQVSSNWTNVLFLQQWLRVVL